MGGLTAMWTLIRMLQTHWTDTMIARTQPALFHLIQKHCDLQEHFFTAVLKIYFYTPHRLALYLYGGVSINQLVELWTRDRKVVCSIPSRSSRKMFLSRVNFLCWFLINVRSTPVLLKWHVKDPSCSVKSMDGRLHSVMHTCTLDPMKSEWADYAVQA